MSRGATNSYGFDFLKKEHTLGGVDAPRAALSKPIEPTISTPVVSAESVAHKPDLEKQADILRFLKAHRSAGYLPPAVIYKGTGIDLAENDESVAQLLEGNPKISIENVPDPENPSVMLATYAYQSKYNHVRDRATLLAQVNRSKYGVDMKDLHDCYDGVEDDISALIAAGDIIAIHNTEDKTMVFFPRGESFLVELDGIVTIGENCANGEVGYSGPTSYRPHLSDDEVVRAALERNRQRQRSNIVCLDTDVDPRLQIRRGEAVCVGGQWFRVSSAVRPGSLADQPARAQAPLSVTSLQDLSRKNDVEYIRPFDQKTIPIDRQLPAQGKENLEKAKMARLRLQKFAGGRGHSSSVSSQLLSSLAHAANPSTLANSFASAVAGGHGAGSSRKRPNALKSGGNVSAEQVRKTAKAAQEAASDPNLSLYSHARRHGCTKDVRQMYLATRSRVPTDEKELYQLLVEHKLLEPGEAWRRPKLPKKSNVDNDGKPKKRRYYERKNQRMTNIHLIDTEIGAVLADAAEKIKQGKQVGDGGM